MIKFLPQGERYSVAAYCQAANACIADIVSRGKQPILVGGTGLYINSLVDNISFTEEETDLELRSKLNKRLEEEGAEALLQELASVDPESAARLHINDSKRIVRALELYYQTGVTITEQTKLSRQSGSPYNPLIIGLNARDREFLYERINRRVDIMLQNGLVDEARDMLKRAEKTSAQAIGHKELQMYFDGTATLEQAADNLKMQTRRYAKRQLTWFRRDGRINWIYADDAEAHESVLERAKRIYLEEGEKGVG
jgi:tRNA dimethylallyltransferase